MALKIRLARFGVKKNPFYRIVVTDSEAPRDGRFIEQIGTYDPKIADEGKKVVLQEDKVTKWLAEGAIPTDTVRSFLKKKGLWKAASNN